METMVRKSVPPSDRNLHDVWKKLEGEVNNRLAGEDKWREVNLMNFTYQVKFLHGEIQTGYGRRPSLTVKFFLKMEDTGELLPFLPREVSIHLASNGAPIFKFAGHPLSRETVAILAAAQLTNGLSNLRGVNLRGREVG